MHLEFDHYGKRAVRVLKLSSSEGRHEVAEWDVDALLEGKLAGSYASDDNTSVVPTDTVKNTIQVLAHNFAEASRESFAVTLARHFIDRYDHLSACDTEVRERLWSRMEVGGTPHPHCFEREANGQPFCSVRATRSGELRRRAGIRGFVIMKTTESGFAGFPRCELTSLPETHDRILSTSLDAEWEYLPDAPEIPAGPLSAMLEVFAGTYSPSVQRTLFLMAEAALASQPGLARVKLTMPNKHYLNLDLTRFGLPHGQKRVFLPTDDPYGYIEAVVSR